MKSALATPKKLSGYLGGLNPLTTNKPVSLAEDSSDEVHDESEDEAIVGVMNFNQANFDSNPYATDDSFPDVNSPFAV